MSTGSFENWAGTITDIGPIYPFVGSEGLLWVIGLALWIAWHVVQTKRETRAYEEEIKKYGDAETLRRLVGEEDPRNP
jgi:hypothetical protein